MTTEQPPRSEMVTMRPSTPQQSTSRSFEEKRQIIAELTKLSLNYPQLLAAEQVALRNQIFLEDLAGLSLEKIRFGCTRYRTNSENRFFPTPGQLIDACRDPYADPPSRVYQDTGAENKPGRVVDGRHQPWGGACECDRCINKTPSPGFYRASKRDHEIAIELRNRLSDVQFREMYGPGTRPVQQFTGEEITRDPAAIEAAIRMSMAALPGGYRK